jgi:hypothetical protein
MRVVAPLEINKSAHFEKYLLHLEDIRYNLHRYNRIAVQNNAKRILDFISRFNFIYRFCLEIQFYFIVIPPFLHRNAL